MSRNYDNWERLVVAVVKREQIWQLCHQDSISSIASSSYLDFSSSLSLGSSCSALTITDAFEFVQRLGNGDFWITTLAHLLQDHQYFDKGTKAVIKLLDAVSLTEDEFEQQMIFLGNCRHENVATPWAYYFSHITKLVAYEYYSQGSVFDMLYGKGSYGSRPNWESRLRIAAGAARGIAHIHAQCGGKMVHGNIKSSNIFLNRQGYGCVSELGMVGIIGRPQKSSRFPSSEKPSQKSDVSSFGLLLLELVTGKSPLRGPSVVWLRSFEPSEENLSWFESGVIMRDELDGKEQARQKFPFVDPSLNVSVVHKEVRKMLEVAKWCLALLPQDRPTMSDAVMMLDTIANSRRAESQPQPEACYNPWIPEKCSEEQRESNGGRFEKKSQFLLCIEK